MKIKLSILGICIAAGIAMSIAFAPSASASSLPAVTPISQTDRCPVWSPETLADPNCIVCHIIGW